MFISLPEVEEVSFRELVPEVPNSKYSSHAIHSYPGQLIPQIPRYYFRELNKKSPQSTVLDPFCGTGTVLVEAMQSGWNSIGIDINPIAVLIAKIKTASYDKQILLDELKKIKQAYRGKKVNEDYIPTYENIGYWFEEQTIINLAKLKEIIYEIKDLRIRDFFLLNFSSIVKDVSKADPRISVPVLPNDGYDKAKYDTLKLFYKRSKENINKNHEFVKKISRNPPECRIINSDVTKTQKYYSDIDLVITSPPYLSAQKYIRATRLESHWLDYDQEHQLKLIKNSVGTERINKKDYSKITYTNIYGLDKIIKKAYEENPQRAGIMSRYFNEMRKTINYLYKCLNSDSTMIMIIGDNTVLGEHFNTSKYIMKLCEYSGFHINKIMKDKIISRGLMIKRNKTSGIIKHEWIVELNKH